MRRPILFLLALLALSQVGSSAAQEEPQTDLFTLQVATVPKTPRFPISIDGELYLTDEDGVLRVLLQQGRHSISVPSMHEPSEGVRVLFERWSDSPKRERQLFVDRDLNLTLGLVYEYEVSLHFVDGLGRSMSTYRVEIVRLFNSWMGFINMDLRRGEGWLRDNIIVSSRSGLYSIQMSYSLQAVYVDGQNVVNRGEQVFRASMREWEIRLLVYPLEIRVLDLVSRAPMSAGLVIERLSGAEGGEAYILDAAGGVAYLPQLPRGDYVVRVKWLFETPYPVILSGPKIENIPVIGGVTIATFGMIAAWLVSSVIIIREKRYRRQIIAIWITLALLLGVIAYILPIAIGGRLISARAEPIYSDDGGLVAFRIELHNRYPVPLTRVYRGPDFEIRLYNGTYMWWAGYESPDYHDVEMDEVRVTSISNGVTAFLISLDDEGLVVSDVRGLSPGEYDAFVMVFGVTSPVITVELKRPLAPRNAVELSPLSQLEVNR